MNHSPVSLSFRWPAFIVAAWLLAGVLPQMRAAAPPADAQAEAKKIFDATGVKGGLVVHLGCGDGALTAALRPNASFQVHGLDKDAAKVEAARRAIQAKGVYGEVAVDRLSARELPYIDNLVNLLVAEDLQDVTLDEVKRVLVPDGVAYVKQRGTWQKIVKPRSSELDEWTHYYYDAKGNAVSKDTVVAPPERLQWVGSPRWSRHHDRMSSVSAQVSAGGRLFYIMDEGSRISILLPSKWHLTARDAFNGVVLWKKPIAQWQTHMWPLKSGPTQLARRLIAEGDRVFVTLSIDGPVSCLDAATGEPVKVYDETKGAEEILLANGTLYALLNPEPWVLTEFAPKHNTGDQKRVETEFNWDEKPRDLVAVDVKSGRLLWKKTSTKIAPLTLATDGKRLAYHDGDKIVCLDAAKGEQRWVGPGAGKRKLFEFNYGPRLLLHGSVVLYAGGDGAMKSFDAESGKELWSAEHEKSGYRSPEDLLVANGLVWNAGTMQGNQTGEFKGRDVRTGEVKVQFPPDVETYWFHHRCYIAKGTERYLLPSRTGIEFVDLEKKSWDINHWVRGACLYGVMPCNGLVYAGPHNCACYPEAKLDGLNALAPAAAKPHPKPLSDEQRLERGPAYGAPLAEADADATDWPTYRHDAARSGYTSQALAADLGKAWDLNLGGRLSAPVIAGGKVFVAQVDMHIVHALDSATGKPAWQFTAGGRVDSPPTYWKGRVVFGCKDGAVYCLRAEDGALIWRFHAAPSDRRHAAFEQLESVWPVHGSVLVEEGIASFASGRSVFLDGGLRFYRVDVASGRKLVEIAYTDKDPETGRDLQEHVKTLQMPVGLNDILSSDGKFTYLRSQKIGADGKRIDISPVSGNAGEQGGAQKGEGQHLFAPMGYLDDSWFHRSYWVYGKHFAGGHNGYYQAGKYTPSGRILVFNDENVYGYGREAKYLKWTTTMEHQLFSASKQPPDVEVVATAAGGAKRKAAAGRRQGAAPAAATPTVRFTDAAALDPSNKPLTVEAWILPDGQDGVIVQHGGAANGYALALQDGKPAFAVCSASQSAIAAAARPIDQGWHHVAGVLTAEKKVRLYVDGQLAAETTAPGLIAKKPVQTLQIGASGGSAVSDYGRRAPYLGLIDQFAIFHRAMGDRDVADRALYSGTDDHNTGAAVACSFDNGDARDDSGHGIHGVLSGVETGKGKIGAALWFRKPGGAPPVVAARAGQEAGPNQGTFVQHQWTSFVPMFTRAMAMAGETIFVSGPPDTVDEEYAFERMTQKDPAILVELAEQDAALDGKRGASLNAISSTDGDAGQNIELDSPPVWDGMAIAQGCLFVSTEDGRINCFGKAKK